MSSISFKSLSAGDVIIGCKPLVHVIRTDLKSKYCDTCLKRSDELKSCAKCLQMHYCDKDCQTMDWKYHKNECKLFRRPVFDMSATTTSEKLLIRLWFAIQSDPTFATQRHRLFDGRTVCLNDIDIDFDRLVENQKILTTFHCLTQCFRVYGLEFDWEELFDWFAIMVSKSMCFRITVTDKLFPYLPIGLALYISTLNISHSCVPNASVVNDGLLLEVRAMRSIGVGEEIAINLVDLDKNRNDRQNLLEKSGIVCKCDKCRLNTDSDMDYELYINLMEKLIKFSFRSDYKKFKLGSIPKVMAFDDSIFGEYHPRKTINLLRLLSVCIDRKECRIGLIADLMVKIEESIPITHGERHSVNNVFDLFYWDPIERVVRFGPNSRQRNKN